MKEKNGRVDFSINITCHGEGLLLYKTLRSIKACSNKLKDKGVTSEINLIADNPTAETLEFLNSGNSILDGVKLYTVEFGNVSDARNYIIDKSNGTYVALIDGDDLVSDNYLVQCKDVIDANENDVVVHPEVQIQFSADDINQYGYWRMVDSEDTLDYRLMLVQYNQYPSTLVAKKDVLLRVKYLRPNNGYGYEDYSYNLDMLAAGVMHKIAPRTVFFYRRRVDGMQNVHLRESTLLRKTDLFDFRGDDLSKYEGIKSRSKTLNISNHARRVAYRVYNSSVIRPIKARIPASIKGAIKKRRGQRIPDWVRDEWSKMNAIDASLWPDEYIVNRVNIHPCTAMGCNDVTMRVGLAYARIMQALPDRIDYVLFTYDPLGAGGTEKVLINYIKALQEKNPDWNFVIFRRRPDVFPFEIPRNVTFIDLDEYIGGLIGYEYELVLDRLLVQLDIKRVHAFWNAWSMHDPIFNWFKRHKKYIKTNNVKLYISWFMDEFVKKDGGINRIMTFADPALLSICDIVQKVMTDNESVIKSTIELTGMSHDKFAVHYQPIEQGGVNHRPVNKNEEGEVRILWASRLSFQKRPDIVKRIAVKLLEEGLGNYKIDVYGRQQNYDSSYLSGIKNVEYCGEFNGFNSINHSQYDLFLYTSQVDGVPNILLEVGNAGIPIIASNDGGVNEVIKNGSTGWLVDIDDIDGYVDALKEAAQDSAKCEQYSNNLRSLIGDRHTWREFSRSVNECIE